MAKKKTDTKVTEVAFQDVPESNLENTEITSENAAENMATISHPAIVTSNKINVLKKKMECKKIMTPDSIVYDANNSGFNVLCNNTFYKVCKDV